MRDDIGNATVRQFSDNGPSMVLPSGLRDYFAAQALIALGSHKAVTARGIPWLTEHAYMVADAMMEQRTRTVAHA